MKKTPEISMTTKHLCQEKQKFEKIFMKKPDQSNRLLSSSNRCKH